MQQQGVEVTVQERPGTGVIEVTEGAKVAVLFSLQVKDEIKAIREQFEALARHRCHITVIPTDFLQTSNLARQFPNESQTKLNIRAFRLVVQWLKDFAELFIELKQRGIVYKILPMHQIMHDELNIQDVHELFGKPDSDSSEALESAKSMALEKINQWAEKIGEMLAKTSVQNPLRKNLEFAEAESIMSRVAAQNTGYQGAVRKYVSKHKFATADHMNLEAALNVYLGNSGICRNTLYVRGRLPAPLVHVENHILKNSESGQSMLPHLIYHEGKLVVASTLPLSPAPEKRPRAPSDGSDTSSSTDSPAGSRRGSKTDPDDVEEKSGNDSPRGENSSAKPKRGSAPRPILGASVPNEEETRDSIIDSPPDAGSIESTPPVSLTGSPSNDSPAQLLSTGGLFAAQNRVFLSKVYGIAAAKGPAFFTEVVIKLQSENNVAHPVAGAVNSGIAPK